LKSDSIKKGIERAPHRSLLYARGCSIDDWNKPFIGIINSINDIVPGHAHLRSIVQAVKEGIRSGGGVPFEGNTIAVCDGIAMNHIGMKYSLPSREIIADTSEVFAMAHAFDALVFIPNCDKVVPGMLMAAARVNLPCIFVSGGPMMAGKIYDDNRLRAIDLITVFEYVGKAVRGDISEERLTEIEKVACPGCGSCSGLYTANTMNCLSEVLGIALPGNGTIPAVQSRRLQLAYKAGQQVMKVLSDDIKPLDLITEDSMYNAFAVDMALGGSTNTILHLSAIAHEAGIKFPLSLINEINKSVPHICKLSPASEQHMEDLDVAGGVPAVMKEISKSLKLNTRTVLGKSLGEMIQNSKVEDRNVIRSLSNPYRLTGGLNVLFGNLAPEGAVVKSAAVAPEMLTHKGPARVFESEEDATAAIMNGNFKSGDILVIRYEGPKGGPGMREMLTPTSLLSGMGMDKEVAMITDGRFSGGSRGAAIGHISPEAAVGGPIAIIKNGDIIRIDIPNYKLDVELTGEEIKQRFDTLPRFEPRVNTGYLKRYADRVTSASTGAVFSD
jgi:dihydroxy-acid dehydratase